MYNFVDHANHVRLFETKIHSNGLKFQSKLKIIKGTEDSLKIQTFMPILMPCYYVHGFLLKCKQVD